MTIFIDDEDDSDVCPWCGSDDYITLGADEFGLPDYSGPKRCENCGATWQ